MDSSYEPHWSDYLKQFVDLSDIYFKCIPNDTNKFCVIVEPRCHSLLEGVLKNFMYLLAPKGWGLIIFHGTQNETFIKDITKDWSNLYLINLNKENLTVSEYNQLLYSRDFWILLQKIGCEYSLIFQTDVILLKSNVDDFLCYDYVGAPWNPLLPWCFNKTLPGGNGGFSLRNVNAMLECLSTFHFNPNMNEDGFFSFACQKLSKKMPDITISSHFSVESFFYNDPIGLHKPLLNYFPEGEYEKLLSKRFI